MLMTLGASVTHRTAGVPSGTKEAAGTAAGPWEVDAQVGEVRQPGEAEGDVDGFAVAQFPDGGGGVGDGGGGDVGCVV